jgi:hydroxymethylbilane synthase
MNNKRKIFIGSRKSNLAIEQASLVKKKLKEVGLSSLFVKSITSRGDKVSYKNFKLEGGKGLFTKDIDDLLINKKIDLAVHSAKDIPANIDKRITIAAYLKRADVRDVLVTRDKIINNLLQLDGDMRFGSSSPRRINYLKSLFPNLKIKNLRGNIESRIKKIEEKKLDGTLLAYAGIKRLKLKYETVNFFKISTKIILPAPGQGAIAILCRKGDRKMINICKKIDDFDTRISMIAERAFIKEINGDCFTPVAALAKISGKKLTIKGRLFSKDGKRFSEKKAVGNIENAKKIGKLCAVKVLKNLG